MVSFITMLLAAGSALALPNPATKQESSSCMAAGQKVSNWKVENFDYHASYIFSTPSHQNSWGYVNFTLSNPALNYKPVCSAASSQLNDFFYGNLNYNCEVPNSHAGDEASFSFNRADGQLNVNQTWACVEEGGRFWAEGGAKLKLNCKEEKYQNPDWKIGQIYSSRTITCDKVTAKAPITALKAVL